MNIILGGGLAGLITKFYNPDYVVFTKDIGGQFSNKFQLGPRFLHKNIYTSKFVQDVYEAFDFNTKTKTINVGYYYDGTVHKECPTDLAVQYYLKSRRIKDADVNIAKQGIMSNSQNKYDVFDFDFSLFIKKMTEKYGNSIKLAMLKHIHLQDQRLYLYDVAYKDIETTCQYYQLISTIPLNYFLQFAGNELYDKLQYSSIYFCMAENPYVGMYDYVYFPTNEKPYYRATYNDNYVTYEFSDYKAYTKFIGEISALHQMTMEIGHVIDLKNESFSFPFIEFIGRLATWQHKDRLEKVVEHAQYLAGSMGI